MADTEQTESVSKNRKKRLIKSVILAGLMLASSALAIAGNTSFPSGTPQVRYWADGLVEFIGRYKEIIAVILSALAGAYMYLRIPSGIANRIVTSAGTVLIPPLAFLLVEAYYRGFWHVGAKLSYETAEPFSSMFLLNLILYYLFYLTLISLFGSFGLGSFIASLFLMVIAIANFYVVQFRGSPIVPWDLLSLRTAGNVAANYDYTIRWQMLFASFGFIFLLLTSTKMKQKVRPLILRITFFVISFAALAALIVSLQDDKGKDFWGIDTTLFTPNVRYAKNGFWPAWLSNLSFLNVEKPDGYSPEKAKEIADDAAERAEQTEGISLTTDTIPAGINESSGNTAAVKPNIIVIMNEAFSDLSVLGDFNTNEDYMPNFRSLMEEYTSGHLLVSVKGGNTANTEYEFLSGDTMAFLPEGSVVYQQYINDELPTIASNLKSLGYSTTAMHPYYGSGWERDRVYPLMGFDEFLDIQDFSGADTLRNYVSDSGAFDKITDILEDGDGESQFIFLVTMQNHSGYTPKSTDNGFTQEVILTGAPAQTAAVVAAERYLTLIKYSDEAFGQLIDYFDQNITEPTIIVMFGDHEPGDYITQVIDDLAGNASYSTSSDNSGAADGTEESLEDVEKHYQVPFVIWNNFGAEKDEGIDLISVNYLAAVIMEEAGLPLSEAQDFLLEMKESIPALAAGAYIDDDGTWHSWSDLDEDDENKDLINDYNIIEYNHLIDTGDRVDSIFTSLG